MILIIIIKHKQFQISSNRTRIDCKRFTFVTNIDRFLFIKKQVRDFGLCRRWRRYHVVNIRQININADEVDDRIWRASVGPRPARAQFLQLPATMPQVATLPNVRTSSYSYLTKYHENQFDSNKDGQVYVKKKTKSFNFCVFI